MTLKKRIEALRDASKRLLTHQVDATDTLSSTVEAIERAKDEFSELAEKIFIARSGMPEPGVGDTRAERDGIRAERALELAEAFLAARNAYLADSLESGA